jgi:hypothetical protein
VEKNMLVLKILGILLAIAALVFSVITFDKHCYRKFSHRFFTAFTYITSTVAIVLGMIGFYWYNHSLTTGGDTLNGIVIIILSALVGLSLFYINFKKTNLLYGITGSALQLLIFGALAQTSITIFIIIILGALCNAFYAKPVYVVNK